MADHWIFLIGMYVGGVIAMLFACLDDPFCERTDATILAIGWPFVGIQFAVEAFSHWRVDRRNRRAAAGGDR